jgi:DNA-binding MarR family transcriptional regulator
MWFQSKSLHLETVPEVYGDGPLMSRGLTSRVCEAQTELVAKERSGDDRADYVDRMLAVWVREIAGLDRLTEGIVERIDILNRLFDHSMETTLAEFGLDRRTHRVLARLRYQGPPYRLSAGRLAEGMGLSSGAMTNRLDRLEAAGLVRRLPDPDDRRGVLVEPTEAGHAAWDRATDTQAGKEALIASALSDEEKEQLHALLRRLMRAFPHEVHVGAKHKKAADGDE